MTARMANENLSKVYPILPGRLDLKKSTILNLIFQLKKEMCFIWFNQVWPRVIMNYFILNDTVSVFQSLCWGRGTQWGIQLPPHSWRRWQLTGSAGEGGESRPWASTACPQRECTTGARPTLGTGAKPGWKPDSAQADPSGGVPWGRSQLSKLRWEGNVK